MHSYFQVVKEAVGTDTNGSLQHLGVKITGRPSGEWWPAVCPCCSDSSGSASFSRTGFLACKQCSRKLDLFDWWAEVHGGSAYEAAQAIGTLLRVPAPVRKKTARKVSKMTTEVLHQAGLALLEDPDAEWARKHFQDRGLWDPEMLLEFGVGFLNGAICFAQFFPNGDLRPRHRSYTPRAKPKWRWSAGPGAPNGFWPWVPLADGEDLLVCEGEMDVLAAYKLARLHRRDRPMRAVTWTGGASAPVSARLMPDSWRRAAVTIVYDNDTFQGPDWKTHLAPDPIKTKEMARRRANLIENVARVFAANKCAVSLAAVPLDPIDRFGADLRDWLTERNEFQDLPRWPLSDMVDPEAEATIIEFKAVRDHLEEFVTVTGSVQAIRELQAVIPKVIRINCPMNCKAACNNCGAPTRFPEGIIEARLHREKLLEAFSGDRPDAFIKKDMLGKPPSCGECDLVYEESFAGSSWSMSPTEDGTKRIHVVSTETPSLAGEIAVTGHVHRVLGSAGIFATRLECMDKPHFDVEEFHQSLLPITPWRSDNPEKIWEHVNGMVEDIASNVTEIYGRPELHLVTMLVAHSVLRYQISGHTYRGWLDACTFGDTRSAKSETVRRLFTFWRLGQYFTCMDNFSRAGLTVGGGHAGEGMVPGIFPKHHGKMIFFDEFHHMAGSKGENPMICLQSARDEGTVSAAKIYGNTKLQASVRLITAGNWFARKRRSLQFPCQHLLHFYGVPESLGRMDFAWCIAGPAKMDLPQIEQVWHSDLARALILRAWAMEPHMIHIEDAAWRLAVQQAREWDEIYMADALPLHTGAEKAHSLIRTACAFANLSYSHPEGKPRECLTRSSHVRCAIDWMLRTWENLQYDLFSERIRRSRTVTQPYSVEALLTVNLGLEDPEEAAILLSQMLEAQDQRQLSARVLGSGLILEPSDFSKWLARMNRFSAFESDGMTSYHITYTPTPGCVAILEKLVDMATNEPQRYSERYRAIEKWFNNPGSRSNIPGIAKDPEGLLPLDTEEFSDGDAATPF
jgi:hypothetical protein